jgi:multiple sugar transport system substrate-binding protein
MSRKPIALIMAIALTLGTLLGACGGATPTAEAPGTAAPPAETTAPPAGVEQITLIVWDYYGEATPIRPLIEAFQAENPDIVIQYEGLDWDTTLEKLNVVLTGGTPPDVVTVDMTWLPTFASLGAFADLRPLSGGMLNGVPWEEAYAAGPFQAINYGGQIVAALYDFDVYALYYRADLFEQNGIPVPTTWDELMQAATQLAEDDQYLYEFDADTFHGSQWIYESGGSLLDPENTAAIFNSPEGVRGIEFAYSLLQAGVAIDWTEDQGERIQGVKDGRIGMFSDGPYYMGIMKSAAPEMAGMWRVAIHPYGTQPGSYLGGTGLAIPASAAHQEAAWRFIEFAMRLENQIGVYTYAGAAPALTAALQSPEVNVADPYFGGQQAFSVFLQALETAHPFPYVREWNDIDEAFTTAMQEIALGQKTVQQALDDAAATVDALLAE